MLRLRVRRVAVERCGALLRADTVRRDVIRAIDAGISSVYYVCMARGSFWSEQTRREVERKREGRAKLGYYTAITV
jgi:hypothetical protein